MTDPITGMSRGQRRYLYLSVFTAGMTSLAVEVSASRLLGSVFGTSNLVWATVIGLMLVYFTLGYFIGGRIADRAPRLSVLYRLIVWGAFLCGVVPMIARPVLSGAAQAVVTFDAAPAIGAFAVVLILFIVPVTLLGCISPFAIRLAVTNIADSGKISGSMYAISTCGSIIGTFLPSLLLFDLVGVSWTFLVFAIPLLLIALYGLYTHSKREALGLVWMPIALLLAAVILFNGPLRPQVPNTTLLYDKESSYNYIQVRELNAPIGSFPAKTRILLLNEGQGFHSVDLPGSELNQFYGGTWDMFLAAPYFNPNVADPEIAWAATPLPVRRLAIIGLAAGTISTQYTAVFGEGIQIDGIEIDPEIVKAGRDYFGMIQPNLNVIVEDGRLGLAKTAGDFDVIGIDAYRVPYVPWHLTTVEFFQEVEAKLSANGVVVINVGRAVSGASQDRRLVEAMTRTMQAVFPTVHTIDVRNSFNTILIATVNPTTPDNLRTNLGDLPIDTPVLLRQAMESAVASLKPSVPSDLVFTDDRAPVEGIVNSMLIDFLTGGGLSQFER